MTIYQRERSVSEQRGQGGLAKSVSEKECQQAEGTERERVDAGDMMGCRHRDESTATVRSAAKQATDTE